MLPCLVTHGTVISATNPKMKVLTGAEHLIAIGEPLVPADSIYPSFVSSAIRDLSTSQKKELAGNSYDTFAWGNFLTYFLANLSLRSDSFASSSTGTVGADGDGDSPSFNISDEIPTPFEHGEVIDLSDGDGGDTL